VKSIPAAELQMKVEELSPRAHPVNQVSRGRARRDLK
jgi:hypothetical protein